MSDSVTKKMKAKRWRRERAHKRVRARVSGTGERPRLSVFKSCRYVYAQIIDDTAGRTLAQASSRETSVAGGGEGSPATVAAARAVGKAIAERAKDRGIEKVVFDRGGAIYHGRVKALAEGAREGGLQF